MEENFLYVRKGLKAFGEISFHLWNKAGARTSRNMSVKPERDTTSDKSQFLLSVGEYLKLTIHFVISALFLSGVVLASIILDLIKKLFLKSKVLPNGKAVFITGCDTGFGNALAKRLDSKGFHVFATCLFPAGDGAAELKASCSNRLHVLHLDVTKDESVEKALKYVNENLGSSGLWAVVNNAGIAKVFSVELSSIEDFRDCLEVNLIGQVRVTKAFLPLLKKTKGRIVNVTSGAGEIPFPFFTPYSASKYAAVGFTECLRSELETSGISVISISPELFATDIASPDNIQKGLDDKMKSCGAALKEDYGDDYSANLRELNLAFLSFACPKISIVVDDLESAVSLVYPHHTYKPRRHFFSRFLFYYLEIMPRSSRNLLTQIVMFIFFSKSERIMYLKKIVMKIVSFI